MVYDGSDLHDLRERLTYLTSGAGGRIVPVLGSGVSLGSVPGTEEIAERFVARLSPGMREGLRARWSESTPSFERYQAAALAVARQQGDAAMSVVIRQAVLEASFEKETPADDVPALRALVREGRWRLSQAHIGFAKYFASIAPEFRGPIITTNFDPLIEVALRSEGINADPVPVAFDDPPSAAMLDNASSASVLHVHGYFAEKWSINSLQHVTAIRTQVEQLLSSLFADATVLVVGYGGWDDSIMRVLERHASQRSIANAEIVWSSFASGSAATASNSTLGRLASSPGFQLYGGIDAAHLFGAGAGMRVADTVIEVPRGWVALPVPSRKSDPLGFSRGARPTWSDATPGQWPQLRSTKTLVETLLSARSSQELHGVAAIGPLGEGKSTGIRQAAMQIANEHRDITVLWRDSGAPEISDAWWKHERPRMGTVVLCVDEADLAQSDIRRALEQNSESGARTILLLACQDRLWWGTFGNSLAKAVELVVYDGMDERDARSIAHRWTELDLPIHRVGKAGYLDEEEVAEALLSAANGVSGKSTLFGSILEVREGAELGARIDSMMESLTRLNVRPRLSMSLADVFGAICVMEHYQDRKHASWMGATQQLIAQMVNAEDSLVNVAVLRALGREASVTFAGVRVYSRHPRIASAAVSWMRRTGRLGEVCRLIGRAGGAMRASGEFERDAYEYAYLLGKKIDSRDEAIAAAKGAIEGASELLEPRITYVSVLRRFSPELAASYAHGITRLLLTARDRRTAIRVYLNELGQIDLSDHLYMRAAGLAGLLLHNGSGNPATSQQVSYGFATLARAYEQLSQQSSRNQLGAQLVRAAAKKVLPAEGYAKYVARHLDRVGVDSEIDRLPLYAQLDRLAREVDRHSKLAVEELGLPFGVTERGRPNFVLANRIDLSDLSQFG